MEKSRVILVTTVSLHFVMGKKYVTVELRGKWDEGLRNFLERRRSYLEEEVGSREGLT